MAPVDFGTTNFWPTFRQQLSGESETNSTIRKQRTTARISPQPQRIPREIKENPKLLKYWKNRFSLFSKFDNGIKLDEESWYSVTPEPVAKQIAERCACNIIIDAFCGAGGNSIQFAKTCNKVIAIDIDPRKIALARNNARIYGVLHKIKFIVAAFFEIAYKLRADAVFLSPPWGGPEYAYSATYDLETMLQPAPLSKLMRVSRNITNNIALFLPRNSDTNVFLPRVGSTDYIEVEKNFLGDKLVSITAYFNELMWKMYIDSPPKEYLCLDNYGQVELKVNKL